tara:strand:- start:1850 stop:2254 length:405 start_codon:yes stop_codon:yes gene_type:complete
MAEIILQLPYPINVSCQTGDIAYYINAGNTVGGFQVNPITEDITEIGIIKQICHGTINNGVCSENENSLLVEILCEININTALPTFNDFILFAKDRSVNESSILGYYSEMVFENNSRSNAELFAAAAGISENSK